VQVGSQKKAVAPPPVAAEGSPAVSNDFVGPSARKSKNKADTEKPTSREAPKENNQP